MFAGKCLQPNGIEIPGTVGAGGTFQLRLAAPATNEAKLWRGTVRNDKNDLSPVGVDQSGAFRWMRYWAELTVMQVNADTFQFSFNPASPVAPTRDDVEILRRARKYLDDAAHWSHQPDPDVYAAATAFAKDPTYPGAVSARQPDRELYSAPFIMRQLNRPVNSGGVGLR
jgi:cytochrome c1